LLGSPALGEKPEFLPAVPRPALEWRQERRVPRKFLRGAVPGGLRKASKVAAMVRFLAAQGLVGVRVETVAPLAQVEVLASVAPSSAEMAVVSFQRPTEALARLLQSVRPTRAVALALLALLSACLPPSLGVTWPVAPAPVVPSALVVAAVKRFPQPERPTKKV